ncbi:alpha/beta hydrolase [Nocardiopsis terrae]|uniref:Dienelactone hydrolase n=1 Tax=Nocardiopsis terrae TaxID=372655 RepID=A0ABR9HDJ2_9ACTN|nr:alpha/beta fold hydrolase [Nocardiopsis terrae]MBE1457099.1 dienelactone hydrolase [Nocardiopsis terrae]GHC90629.1 alpha/beta hydrolase [Nocardiopsis terrae]
MSTPASAPALSRRTGRPRTALAAVLVTGALIATACSPDDDGPTLPGAVGHEREVSFHGGGFTVPGTFTAPAHTGDEAVPGVLVISGSGPTDRDGNSQTRPEADTNLNLARVLSGAGAASLRYDKFGSGDPADMDEAELEALEEPVDPSVYDQQMAAAYEELVAQPEVDPERTVILGHSEGALFALRAHEVLDAEPALVLAAPPGTRMLDLIDRQLTEQVRTGEARGAVGTAGAVQMLSDTRAARAAIRGGRELPPGDATGLFSPENEDYLAWIDSFDPVELASELPSRTPVLVLWGEEDAQVNGEEVDRLMTGLSDAERVDLPGVDHVLREYDDSPGAAAPDADRPFSSGVAPAVEEFLDGL